MDLHPPKRALQFLHWFCKEDYLEEVEGDLTEIFEKQYEESPTKANRNFIWSILWYFRPEFIKSFKKANHPNNIAMLRHNFLITFRNFKRYKTSFLINITGLSTGLACVLFIYLWVADEMNVDKFYEKEGELYQFFSNLPMENEILTLEGSPLLMTKTIVEDFPEVEKAVAISQEFCSPKGILTHGYTSQKSQGIMASTDFFNTFSFELLIGDKSQVLSDKSKIVLSEELARKLFEKPEDAIGETLNWNYQWDDGVENFLVTVSGVFKEIPTNSTFQFDAVGHTDLLIDTDRWAGDWSGSYVHNYS